MAYPCQVCNLRKECNAKGDTNECGMTKAFHEAIFFSQQLHYFIIKNPLRRLLHARFKKHATIDADKYERITGTEWIHKEDPFPEWTKKIKGKKDGEV